MPRPPKCRRVAFLPSVTHFKPAGIPLRTLEEIQLSIEEVEAIRLKDLEGLEQEQGAEHMNVSRSTFQRVLASARRKIADALLNGTAIRVMGGSYEMTLRRFRCGNEHEWDVPFEVMVSAPPQVCPTCNTPSIEPLSPAGFRWKGRGQNRRRGSHRRNSLTDLPVPVSKHTDTGK